MTGAVLIVDDNLDLLENLEQILSEEGVAVFTADCGQKAIEVVAKHDVSLVVSDMRMPGMSGLELLERLRAERPELQVVMMTAFARERSMEAARTAHALDVLPKPLPFGRLFELIELALHPWARVLVLEDDAELSANLAEAVASTMSVLPLRARTIAEARRILATTHVDAAVIDVRLPDGNGSHLAAELRAQDVRWPVILVSGYVKEDVPQCIFEKPFSSRALIQALDSMLRERELAPM